MMTYKQTLILDHIFLADKIARKKSRSISSVRYEELQSAAYLGLVEAADKYESEKSDCFASFAVWRIIGAMRDYLRELAWGTRNNPVKIYEIENV